MTQVMKGVRVLEVAQFTYVPAAGAILADWGADVIKIEHPVRGDTQRGFLLARAERGGDRIDGDIVMRRPDAAGGEQIVVARPQRVDGFDDAILYVGHDSHFGEPDSLQIEPERDLRNILVLSAARQDFVTDHTQCGCPDAFACHVIAPSTMVSLAKQVRAG